MSHKRKNSNKIQAWCILICLIIYCGCLLTSIGLIMSSLQAVWYKFADEDPRGLFWETCNKGYDELCSKDLSGSEYTMMAFLFLGGLSSIAGVICSIVLMLRLFGCHCCRWLNTRNLIQFEILYIFLTLLLWYMAIASFCILTPQRLVLRVKENVHYDRSLRISTFQVQFADGFYFLMASLILSFVAMFASISLEAMVNHRFANSS